MMQPHYLIPDWPDCPHHVKALITTRIGGVSAGVFGDLTGCHGWNLADHVGDEVVLVEQNRTRLNQLLPQAVQFPTQVHGIAALDCKQLSMTAEQTALQADAVFSDSALQVCGILTADCLPVLLADRSGHMVAAAHAGWRGLALGVLENTVQCMRDKGARDLCAYLGPAIGASAFEVGHEVLEAFLMRSPTLPEAALRACFVAQTPDNSIALGSNPAPKYLADLAGIARLVLTQLGVRSIAGGDLCTVSDAKRFYSYRRDGQTGRMASLIWIASAP